MLGLWSQKKFRQLFCGYSKANTERTYESYGESCVNSWTRKGRMRWWSIYRCEKGPIYFLAMNKRNRLWKYGPCRRLFGTFPFGNMESDEWQAREHRFHFSSVISNSGLCLSRWWHENVETETRIDYPELTLP